APDADAGEGAGPGAGPGAGAASPPQALDAAGKADGRPDNEWIFQQIERLGELHARGLLTDEEFSAKKAELLGRI
ncbi:SHOCT domain-containing protein, partial [Nocardiopsis dassonvillei]